MRTDHEIQKEVYAGLEKEAIASGSVINAEVSLGQVTLTGVVDSYPKKINSENAVRNVDGVRSVSNEIEVRIPQSSKRSDAEIEKSIINVIKWNSAIDESRISVIVTNGCVSLDGSVDWDFQRLKARLLAGDITGVVDVINHITVCKLSNTG